MADVGVSDKLVLLPALSLTPRQQQHPNPMRSPRQLGELVSDVRTTLVQRRVRMLEDKVVSKQINPIAAWPSTASKAVHAVSTRPPLSIELENYIRKEQRNLLLEKPTASKLELLAIYREVFGSIIHHFQEYSGVLSAIKEAYDATITELNFSVQRAAIIELENKSMEGTHAMQLLQEREKMQSCLSEANTQLQAALRTNQMQRQHIAKLELENALCEQKVTDRKKEYDESQERIRVLSVTLVEEATKMSVLISDNVKANNEVDRLNHLVESLRQLVSESERTIQAFRMAPVEVGGSEEFSGEAHSSGRSFRKARHSSQSSRPTLRPLETDESPASFSPTSTLHTPAPPRIVPNRKNSTQGSPLSGDGSGPSSRGGQYSNDEVEALRERLFDLECQIEGLQHSNNQQSLEMQRLQSRLTKLQQETTRDTLTPRPDWSSVAMRLKGFHHDKARSTNDNVSEMVLYLRERLRVETLENERKAFGEIVWNWLNDDDMCETDLLHRYKYFIPRGTAKTVPVYLRSGQPIRNRRLKKSDVEILLGQFWTYRLQRRKTIPFPSVEESWMEWATKESGSVLAAVELSYNILDVCERNLQDPDCKLFLKVIRSDLTELVVADQRESLDALQNLCKQLRVQNTNDVRISAHNFFKALRIVFPGKSRDHMDKIRFIFALWNPKKSDFDYRDLFSEDGEKSQHRLIELLRKQHIDEIEHFTVEVCEAVRSLMTSDGKVCVADAMNAVTELDPAITDSDVQLLFSNVCRLTLPDLLNADRSLAIDGEMLIHRLRQHVLLKRVGPPDTDNSQHNDIE